MRRRRRIFHNVQNTQPNGSNGDYFESHPSKLQFFVNLVLVILTLVTLFATSNFSNQSLKLSSLQYKTTINQFKYQRSLDSVKDKKDSIINLKLALRYITDSLRQAQTNHNIEKRNNNQDLLNLKQLAINNQQLLAIKSQAQTAKKQSQEQSEQYKQQFFERRPFFAIDNVIIDTINNYKSKIAFNFSNKGVRTAHVDSCILAFYNSKYLCQSITPNPANLDAPQQQYLLSTSHINIYKDCLDSPNTVYFLLIYYKDFATGENKEEPIFFQYSFNKQKLFLVSRLFIDRVPLEFKSLLIKKGIIR